MSVSGVNGLSQNVSFKSNKQAKLVSEQTQTDKKMSTGMKVGIGIGAVALAAAVIAGIAVKSFPKELKEIAKSIASHNIGKESTETLHWDDFVGKLKCESGNLKGAKETVIYTKDFLKSLLKKGESLDGVFDSERKTGILVHTLDKNGKVIKRSVISCDTFDEKFMQLLNNSDGVLKVK